MSRNRSAVLESEQEVSTEDKPKRTRTRNPYAITVKLDPEVWAFFHNAAIEDDRELDKYVARLLKQHYNGSVPKIEPQYA
jgi:hypothetical protein